MDDGAQYGSNLVPVDDTLNSYLGYLPGNKALELLGFVEDVRAPLHMMMDVRPCCPIFPLRLEANQCAGWMFTMR